MSNSRSILVLANNYSYFYVPCAIVLSACALNCHLKIATVIKEIVTRICLPLDRCRGHGAAVMQGKHFGLATRLRQEAAATPVQCLAHPLNLCHQDTGKKIQVICDGLDLVRKIVKLVNFSKTLFQSKSTEKEEATGSGTIFMPLCPTCWTIRTAATDSALKQYSITMETMTENTRWIMTSKQVVFLLLWKTFHTIWLAVRSSFAWSSREYFQGIAGKGFVCTRGLSCATLLKSFYERHRTDNSFETFMRLQMHLVLSWKSTASPSHVITSDQNNSIAAVNHTDLTIQKYGFDRYTLKLVTSSLVNSLLI